MRENSEYDLREQLVQLPTPQLDRLLWEALEQEEPDGETVRAILRILDEREAEEPLELSGETRRAWEHYRAQEGAGKSRGKLLRRAAAAAAILILAFALFPQKASAKIFFERLISWTDSVFSLFSPDDQPVQPEYEFKTENPGLQQLYDTLTEMGVDVPVVPMWLPEGYELIECKITETPAKKDIYTVFGSGAEKATYKVSIYSSNQVIEFSKDESKVDIAEIEGICHNVFKNNGMYGVVWVRNNIECSILIDCQEETLYTILRSIYSMEDD